MGHENDCRAFRIGGGGRRSIYILMGVIGIVNVEIALVISFLSMAFSIIFGLKNNKRADTKEVEQRVAETTRIEVRLESISRDLSSIKDDLRMQRMDIKGLGERLAKVEASAAQAHKRLDRMDGGKEHAK